MRAINQLILIFSLIATTTGFTATRVTEVEGMIRKDVTNYIQMIKPDLNFSVFVKVEPRLNTASRAEQGESLPFFTSESEVYEIEPWSDPETPPFKLYAKIQKASVQISFTTDIDVQNIKDLELNILRSAGLVIGRDEVRIELLNTPLISKNFSTVLFSEKNISVTIMSLVILFLGTVMFVTLNRYLSIRTNVETSSSDNNKNDPLMPAIPLMNQTSPIKRQSSNVGKLSFSDPTRSTELLRDKIKQILDSQTFPNLNDMIILMDLLESNIKSFAFFVYELPKQVQDEVYAKGKTDLWYKGFSEIGEIDPDIFHSIDRMLRSRNYKSTEVFEELLIQCWRMNDNLGNFLHKIDKSEAISILYYLPKKIAIRVARDAFPGGWGDLLADTKIPAISKVDRLKSLLELSYEFSPKYTKSSLDTYTKRQDLLEYLKLCRTHEEEDIYKIIGDGSLLEQIRPPFYKFFYLDKENMRSVFDSITIDRWAITLFEINRDYRIKLDAILDEKERYMIDTYLSQFTATGLDNELISNIKEEIGHITNQKLKVINKELEKGIQNSDKAA